MPVQTQVYETDNIRERVDENANKKLKQQIEDLSNDIDYLRDEIEEPSEEIGCIKKIWRTKNKTWRNRISNGNRQKFGHFVGKFLHNLAIKLRFVNFNELGSVYYYGEEMMVWKKN